MRPGRWACPRKIGQFMGNSIFVDTGWFKGLIDHKDGHHDEAVEILKVIVKDKTPLITTNFVVDETFTLVRDKCGVYGAKMLFDWMQKFGMQMTTERVRAEDEGRVWKWFWYDWRELSYTDCTSFAVMERLGLKKSVTFDEHFEMAGFGLIK